jgi:autoinducer 2-degrading protein
MRHLSALEVLMIASVLTTRRRRVLRSIVILVLIACAWPLVLNAQDDATLYVVSYVEAVPASQGQVATMLKQLADASRKEGPARFEVLQRITEPNQFLILEIWKDQRALDTHGAAAHTRQFREQIAPMLLAPIDDRFCVAATVAPLRDGRGTVYVVTHVDVPPASRAATVASLQALAERSRTDPGNVRFDAVVQKDRTNHFTVIDVWADQKAGDNHQVAPHTRTFRTQVAPMLGALYDQRSYKPL